MSPEQIRGEPPDARTDLFSLGVVLYEMATGTLPFKGNTTGVVFDAILHRDPVPPEQLHPDLPAGLQRIVLRALEKDRDVRYQTALDLKAELKRVRREHESRQNAAVAADAEPRRSPSAALERRTPARIWYTVLWAAAALVITVLIIIKVGWFSTSTRRSLPESNQKQLTANPIDDPVVRAAISPDGKYLAYTDLTGIHLLLVDTGENRVFAAPANFCFR